MIKSKLGNLKLSPISRRMRLGILALLVVGTGFLFGLKVSVKAKPFQNLNTVSSGSARDSKSIALAIIVNYTGEVTIGQNHTVWTKAADGELIREKDSIKTGPSSMATVMFDDGSYTRLWENTEVTLEKYNHNDDSLVIKILQRTGKTWNRVQKLLGASSYSVETPTTIATVRGTAFGVDTTDKKSSVYVVEGQVATSYSENYLPKNLNQEPLVLSKMQSTSIGPITLNPTKGLSPSETPIKPEVIVLHADPLTENTLPDWIIKCRQEDLNEMKKVDSARQTLIQKEEIIRKENRDNEKDQNQNPAGVTKTSDNIKSPTPTRVNNPTSAVSVTPTTGTTPQAVGSPATTPQTVVCNCSNYLSNKWCTGEFTSPNVTVIPATGCAVASPTPDATSVQSPTPVPVPTSTPVPPSTPTQAPPANPTNTPKTNNGNGKVVGNGNV